MSLVWNTASKVRSCSLLAALAVSIAVPSPSFALGPAGLAREKGEAVIRLVEGERALAPFASVVFCMKQPQQCQDTGGASITILDAKRREELMRVNASVNRAIRPVNDKSGTDDWSVDVAQGDCEDFALTKRKQLLELGWSSRSLRIAVAYTSAGEGHAVLIAKTSDGDLVLDNRNGRIKDWRATNLRWVMVQSESSPKQWVSLRNASAGPIATAEEYKLSETADIGNY